MKTNLKNFGWLILGIAGIFAITLLLAYLVYPPEFINRLIRWGNADVYDYLKFPKRELEASNTPFEFFPTQMKKPSERVLSLVLISKILTYFWLITRHRPLL